MTEEDIRKLQKTLLMLPISYPEDDDIRTVVGFIISALIYFEMPLLKKSSKATKATISIEETSHAKVTFITENGDEQTKDPFCRFCNSNFTEYNYRRSFDYLRKNFPEYKSFLKFNNESLTISLG